jgi:hypothetical protein
MSGMEEEHIRCYIEHVLEQIGKESLERGGICGGSGDQLEQESLRGSTKETVKLLDASRILRYIEGGLRD